MTDGTTNPEQSFKNVQASPKTAKSSAGEVMKYLSPIVRLTFGLASLTATALYLAYVLGIMPDQRAERLRARAELTECIAVHFSSLSPKVDIDGMANVLAEVISRNPELQSIAIRNAEGNYLFEAGDHLSNWKAGHAEEMSDTQTEVPLYANSSLWGTLEVRFVPTSAKWFGFLSVSARSRTVVFVGLICVGLFYVFLRRALAQLNPTKAVPRRVHEALDALAEGLTILDEHSRIVMSNSAFSNAVAMSGEELMGQSIDRFHWQHQAGEDLPWKVSLQTGETLTGVLIRLSERASRTFSVSAVPIRDEDKKIRGVMVSFEDVTDLENNKAELVQMLDELRTSREEIQEQNQELERLAMQDPLTGCLNRRAFFGRFELQWRLAIKKQTPLSIIIVDVDHFKSVNDTYGHAVGDEVLRSVGKLLSTSVENDESACRYGGEEFCILLPNTSLEQATHIAEQLRIAISELKFEQLSIKASLGVSSRDLGAASPQLMLEQADKCLYSAKRNGRNRVVRFDEIPAAEVNLPEPTREARPSASPQPDSVPIPFEAVSALLTALSFRDQPTADHSRRVADLCVQTAEKLLSKADCYTLEMAALLHDVGKVGIPDSILRKSSALDADEWTQIHQHQQNGIEILRKAFASTKLASIVQTHYAYFNGCSRNSSLPAGHAIPIEARILAIVDAYDSMRMNRPYRPGCSHEEAIAELQRCAGTQFDPKLVERFVEVVSNKACAQDSSPQTEDTAATIAGDLNELVACLQEEDFDRVQVITEHLKYSAQRIGATKVTQKAEKLQAAILSDSDLLEILHSVRELTAECKSLNSSQN